MKECLYYTAQEVQEMLEISRAKACQVVKKLNEELASMGYIVISGKVPKQFLADKYYGMRN